MIALAFRVRSTVGLAITISDSEFVAEIDSSLSKIIALFISEQVDAMVEERDSDSVVVSNGSSSST